MLDMAIIHKVKLHEALARTCLDHETYKWYNHSNWQALSIDPDLNTFNKLQMVSIDNQSNILGYFNASFYRITNVAQVDDAIRFTKRLSYTFSKDFYDFLHKLFNEYYVHKIKWLVVSGNPAQKMYERLIKKYNGYMSGVSIDDVIVDGKYHDMITYEIFKSQYDKVIGTRN